MRAKFLFALVVSAGIFSVTGSGAPRSASLEMRAVVMGGVPSQTQPTLLADEINRRLSRLGISFNRLRIPHPYDPVGEVC